MRNISQILFFFKLDQRFKRICRLKIIRVYCSGDHFVRRSGPIYAVVVESIMWNVSVKLFRIQTSSSGGDEVKYFLVTAQAALLFDEQNYLCNIGR